MKFIHPTYAQTAKTFCYVLAVLNSLLAVSATLYNLPFIPPKVAMYWPVGYMIVFGVLTVAHVFGFNPDPELQAKLAAAIQDGLQILQAISAAKAQATTLQAPKAEASAVTIAPGLTPALTEINALAAAQATAK